MSIPYRPFQSGFFNENDSTVDQLLDELNMAEEYSNDRKRVRDRNTQSIYTNTTASSDPTISFGNSNYWDPLTDTESNNYDINSYNRYRDHDTKQKRYASGASSTTALQFHNPSVHTDIAQSPKRSTATATITSNVHDTVPSESSRSSGGRTSDNWTYRHPIIMQSIKSTMANANGNKRKNNLSKASLSPNLNVSFLTESERLAKTDLFLLPSDGTSGGHLYTGLADTSPSGDCSELMQVCAVSSI